jgi:hypothetical protein
LLLVVAFKFQVIAINIYSFHIGSSAKQSNRGTTNWNLVAWDVPGRSQNKCYHRYIHLTREKMITMFEPEDDRLLIEQHQLKNGITN